MKQTKKNKSINTLTICLIVVAVLLIAYTSVVLYLFLKTGNEPSTLTTCFFATFSFEVVGCTAIKIFKIKFPAKEKNDDYNG